MRSFDKISLLIMKEMQSRDKIQNCRRTRTKFGRAQLDHGEYSRQVSEQSEEWSRRRSDDKFVTVLSKREDAISKMSVWRLYAADGPESFSLRQT